MIFTSVYIIAKWNLRKILFSRVRYQSITRLHVTDLTNGTLSGYQRRDSYALVLGICLMTLPLATILHSKGEMKMTIVGTKEQEEIWNDMENGDSHMVVKAGAGTGKTFTIVEGAKRISGGKKGFLAFNKSIATELGKKLPLDCKAMTFHSLGLSSIKRFRKDAKVDTKKTYNIIRNIFGPEYKSAPALNKLISLLKSSLADWQSISDIRAIIDQYNIEFDGIKDEKMAIDMLPTMRNMCEDISVVDFDDMIWLPVVLELPVEHYDTVFVDEAQDFNESQRQLILRACNGGRMIVVGDTKQAIYGFRGADSASMDIFREELVNKSTRGVKDYTLSITWRCPKSIVAEANRFFSDYTCREDAPEGEVNVNAAFVPKGGDLVLCRVNAPLVSECFSLITQGIPAYVLGRDIGYSLQVLVKKVTDDSSMTLERFLPALADHVDKRINALKLQEKDKQIQSLTDKHDCILALAGNVNTVGGLLDNIKEIFGEQGKKAGVVFSTIHKAKGLEAENVWILEPQLMPHPMATTPADRQQETNLCYVAITRAMKTLNYVGDRVG